MSILSLDPIALLFSFPHRQVLNIRLAVSKSMAQQIMKKKSISKTLRFLPPLKFNDSAKHL